MNGVLLYDGMTEVMALRDQIQRLELEKALLERRCADLERVNEPSATGWPELGVPTPRPH
jgi:hypothetical protein